MSYVQFQHKSYGIMTTIPEYWIQYEIFDATDEVGDVAPVYKADCENPKYIEE